MDEPGNIWNYITYICGVITLLIATAMILIVVVQRLKRRPKSIFHCVKNTHTKTKTILCSKGDGHGSSSFCCTNMKPQEFEDEGYVSEHGMAAVTDTEEYTPVSSIFSTGEESNHELIVEVAKPPVSDITYVPEEESEGTAPSVVKDEIGTVKDEIGTEKASSSSRKKRWRSKRKRRTPVMETKTLRSGQDELCIAVNDRHSDVRQKARTSMQCRDIRYSSPDTVKSTNMLAYFV